MNDTAFTEFDQRMMRRALELAARGLNTTDPNPRVGCVLTQQTEIVGEGWHRRAGEAHAEVEALQNAGARARGATAYVTLEPCAHQGRTPPCTDALLAAGVQEVVYAVGDPDPRVNGGGSAQLQAAGLRVRSGLCAAEATELNCGFLSRLQRGRPFVRLKVACSLDGRTALANGASQWITGDAARADVQHWRARSAAILTGSGTVLADNPQLNVRVGAEPRRQPLRVIVDSRLRTPRSARVLAPPGRAVIFARRDALGAELADAARGALQRDGIGLEWAESAHTDVDLHAVLEHLARDCEVNELLVEAGATLSGALLTAGLVDELLLYVAPTLLGPEARPLAQLPAITELTAAQQFEFHEIAVVGGDLRLRLRPRRVRATA
jgi:diaminohydroxyphosphoribosylaminopyrimidine deaminase/5-amino-6-(5-phosphoribosylamino)uracil reductase